jgi:DNA relaxase NicK
MLLTSIDYFSGTGFFDSVMNCEDFIDEITRLIKPRDEYYIESQEIRLGEKFTSKFGSVFKMYGGIKTTSDQRVKLALQLPGTFCQRFENQHEAIKFLGEHLKPTRIDIALDDYKRRISQKGIDKLGELGHYKGVESYELISSKTAQDSEKVSTCYFGSSLKSVRFYNAEKVHGFPADRWELQARGEYSEQISSLIKQTLPEDLSKIQASLVTHAIDFVRKGENWRSEQRYYFWEKLREGTEAIKLRGPSTASSLEKSTKWLDKQVCPTLSMLYFGLGRTNYLKYMETLAMRGKKRLNEQQLAIIAYLQRTSEESYLNLPERKKL